MAKQSPRVHDVKVAWIVEVRAPEAYNGNFWQPYDLCENRSAAMKQAKTYRREQDWCRFRVKRYARS